MSRLNHPETALEIDYDYVETDRFVVTDDGDDEVVQLGGYVITIEGQQVGDLIDDQDEAQLVADWLRYGVDEIVFLAPELSAESLLK